MTRKQGDWTDESTSEVRVEAQPLVRDAVPAILQMVQGPGAPRRYELFSDEMVVGRGADADIPVPAGDLSRRHVVVRKSPYGEYSVTDLESRNGLFLNGVKVHSATLHDGDTIQLGTVVLVFVEGHSS